MRVLPLLLMTLCLTVLAATVHPDQEPLRVVPKLDYERYSGTWFEVARLPFRYQKDCASDVTASYAPRSDGRIAVINRCLRANGAVQQAEGVARRVGGQPSSVLKVRFAPAFLTFLPMVWGDYQVIALGADYEYSVVGTPDRSYLWFLSRTPRLERQVYDELVQQAKSQGFDVARLIETRHTASAAPR